MRWNGEKRRGQNNDNYNNHNANDSTTNDIVNQIILCIYHHNCCTIAFRVEERIAQIERKRKNENKNHRKLFNLNDKAISHWFGWLLFVNCFIHALHTWITHTHTLSRNPTTAEVRRRQYESDKIDRNQEPGRKLSDKCLCNWKTTRHCLPCIALHLYFHCSMLASIVYTLGCLCFSVYLCVCYPRKKRIELKNTRKKQQQQQLKLQGESNGATKTTKTQKIGVEIKW